MCKEKFLLFSIVFFEYPIEFSGVQLPYSAHQQGESECLFPEGLWGRERTYLAFGARCGAERGLKTMGYSISDCIKQY